MGTQKNWINIYYKKYEGEEVFPSQLYSLKYKDLSLLYARITLADFLTYEKVFPIGKRSKKTFAAWDNNKYYEYDFAGIMFLFSYLTGKEFKLPLYIYDIGVGFIYNRELYTSELDLKLSNEYKVYYATQNGGTIQIQQLLTNTRYSVLQEFYKKIFYVKFYSSLLKTKFFKWLPEFLRKKTYGVIGYGQIKTNQPITWYYINLFGPSYAVIVRTPIKSTGLYLGGGFAEKFSITDNFYLNKLEAYVFLPIKTEYIGVQGFSLTPDAFFTTNELYLFNFSLKVNGEYRITNHLFFDITYNPEIWIINVKDPIYGFDPLSRHIVHHLNVAITYSF